IRREPRRSGLQALWFCTRRATEGLPNRNRETDKEGIEANVSNALHSERRGDDGSVLSRFNLRQDTGTEDCVDRACDECPVWHPTRRLELRSAVKLDGPGRRSNH